jgi:hypothetical protein
MIEVIDNFLPAEYFAQMQKEITSSNFPWSANNGATCEGDDEILFAHSIYQEHAPKNEMLFNNLVPLIEQLNCLALIRIKLNLYPRCKESHQGGWHVDVLDTNVKYKTAILFLNTTNGPLLFKSGEKVDCVENTIVIFDGKHEHAYKSQTDEKYRINMNINWIEY